MSKRKPPVLSVKVHYGELEKYLQQLLDDGATIITVVPVQLYRPGDKLEVITYRIVYRDTVPYES